jgi:hypothetical protein
MGLFCEFLLRSRGSRRATLSDPSGNQMKKLAIALVLISSPAFAQNATVTEPVCEPTGRTSKGDLVYSMECRNIPGLAPGDKPAGYNPSPKDATVPQPNAASPKVPESK